MDPTTPPAPAESEASVPSQPRELTGEEAALYDRQIRLWGLEAQRKLASSTVLLTGDLTCLLSQEIAKNLVLAGIAKLSFMLDLQPNTGIEPAKTFLGTSLEHIVLQLKDMNPHVEVGVTDEPIEAIRNYGLVCAIGLPRKQEFVLSDTCRAAKVPFLTGRVAGITGWVFLDVGHRYRYQERSVSGDADHDDAMSMNFSNYCSYREAIDAPWRKEPLRSEYGWHYACALQQFHEAYRRLPGEQLEDCDHLLEIYEKLRKEKKYAAPAKENLGARKDMLTTIGKAAHVILSPVAAVVGGMWGREVIKIVSGKDEPLNNFFFFNAHTSAGSVERVGPPRTEV